MYDASVAVHASAALIGFGVTFAYPVIFLAGQRRDLRALSFAISVILALSRWVAVPATLLVGVTGIYQLASGPYGLGDVWTSTGLALYLAVMLVGVGYLAPALRRAQRIVDHVLDSTSEGRPVLPPDYRATMRPLRPVGVAVSAAVIATMVLMVLKP